VLIGGKIVNRGLDLSGGCESLILATGGQLWSDFNQKIGRAVRHNSNGKGRVYDFLFRTNKYLYKHSRARLQAVVEMGYKATVIYKGGKIDGRELIRRRFRLPR
jgi:superfamily II DNA or RNA helicase